MAGNCFKTCLKTAIKWNAAEQTRMFFPFRPMCWYCPHTGSNLNQSAWRDASTRCLIDALIHWLSTVESAQSKQRTGESSASGSSRRGAEASWQNVYELQITAESCRLAGLTFGLQQRRRFIWWHSEQTRPFYGFCCNIILMCDWEVHVQPLDNEVTLTFIM